MSGLLTAYFTLLILSLLTLHDKGQIIAIALVPSLLGLVIGRYLLKRFKTEKRTRTQNIVFYATIIVLSCILTTFLLPIAGERVANVKKEQQLVIEDIVLQLTDFNTNDADLRTRIVKKGSIFVPNYVYYSESLERKTVGNEVSSVGTTYMRCLNQNIANYAFNSYLAEKHNWHNLIIEFSSKKINSNDPYSKIFKADESLWDADEVYYLNGDKTEVIIRRGLYIYVFRSNADLSQAEAIKTCIDKTKVLISR